MSVRMRLTLWYTGILSATLLLLGMGLYLFLHYIYYDSLQSQLQQQAESVRTRIVPQFSLSEKGLTLEFRYSGSGRDLLRYNNMYFQVVNLQNGSKYYSPNVEEAGLHFPDIPAKQISCVLDGDCRFEKIKIDGLDFLVYYTPIISQRGEAIGMMQAGTYIEPYEQLLATLRLILTVTALLSIVLASSVGWFLARKALRPIERVIEATNQIQKGADLQKRIEYHGPNDEIGVLTQTINGMLSRLQSAYEELEEAYRAQRRFVSDASHELRTPLTTIRGNVELLEKMWKQTALQIGEQDGQRLELSIEAMKDISGEAERMSRLVGDLLSLARADAGFQISKTHVEMKTLLDEVARKAQMLPRTADFVVGDLSAGEGVYVYGSPDYLQQLMFIFVENAFKYTEQGSVRLDAQRHKDQIGIRIADTGIGMDKEEVPHIFERFYRADPSRGKKSGTGLGLSIAKWIIDEHGGSVEVKTRKDEGTTFVIWLPIVAEGTSPSSDHSLPSGNEV
ncbi:MULTISPECIES: ATP-binding protein [unclassified Paenibacillus]|uniref:ATP-binding protein n=1 Tax=unclassified Paenibacillus TaxID=185978 RepID=UPI0021182790|nr:MULTISPECIES: ATP-binding protein [unclassified Paenibacillus]